MMLGSNSISRRPNSAGSGRNHTGNRSTTHVKGGRAGVKNLAHCRYLYVVLPATCLFVFWLLISAAILIKGVPDQHEGQITADLSALGRGRVMVASLRKIKNPASNVNADATTIFVISLQGTHGANNKNEGRFDAFKAHWEQACGLSSTVKIEHCPGVVDTRRGYGLTMSHIICMRRAKALNQSMTVTFEDDARLFESATASFCNADSRSQELWSHLPDDALLAFLGGHDWDYEDTDKATWNFHNHGISSETSHSFNLKALAMSYGTYGLAIPRRNLDILIRL